MLAERMRSERRRLPSMLLGRDADDGVNPFPAGSQIPLFSNLVRWFDANREAYLNVAFPPGNTLAGTGEAVGIWGDRRGWDVTDRYVLQSTFSNRPLISVDDDDFRGIKFDGINDYLSGPNPISTSLSSIEFYVVLSADVDTSVQQAFVSSNISNNANGFIRLFRSGGNVPAVSLNQALVGGSGGVTATTTALSTTHRNIIFGSINMTTKVVGIKTNSNARSTTTGTFSGTTFPSGISNLHLGVRITNSLVDYQRSSIHEFGLYNRELTTDERSSVISYADQKWSLGL